MPLLMPCSPFYFMHPPGTRPSFQQRDNSRDAVHIQTGIMKPIFVPVALLSNTPPPTGAAEKPFLNSDYPLSNPVPFCKSTAASHCCSPFLGDFKTRFPISEQRSLLIPATLHFFLSYARAEGPSQHFYHVITTACPKASQQDRFSP